MSAPVLAVLLWAATVPEPAVVERVGAAGGAFVGAATGALMSAAGALAVTSALSAADDPRSLALVLGSAPLAAGAGAFLGASFVGVEHAFIPALAGLAGAGLGAGVSAGLAITQPQLFDDDLGAALLVLVAVPAAGGALAAGVVAPFCVASQE